MFNLETAVGREKDVQDIDVHGEFEKRVVTLLVMSAFSHFPGASRACADFRDPAAVFRFNVKRLYYRSYNGSCIRSLKAALSVLDSRPLGVMVGVLWHLPAAANTFAKEADLCFVDVHGKQFHLRRLGGTSKERSSRLSARRHQASAK
jgi:hypothetical protein